MTRGHVGFIDNRYVIRGSSRNGNQHGKNGIVAPTTLLPNSDENASDGIKLLSGNSPGLCTQGDILRLMRAFLSVNGLNIKRC